MTRLGSVMSLNELQLLNAYVSIVVADSRLTDARDEHPLKA